MFITCILDFLNAKINLPKNKQVGTVTSPFLTELKFPWFQRFLPPNAPGGKFFKKVAIKKNTLFYPNLHWWIFQLRPTNILRFGFKKSLRNLYYHL